MSGGFLTVGRASAEQVSDCEEAIGYKLPEDYVGFQMNRGHGEGFIGEGYLVLWDVSDLWLFNQEYEVRIYCPAVLLFGSNGGGEGYGFRAGATLHDVVAVPLIGMGPDSVTNLASSFSGFIEYLDRGV